jgi:hypothetical protein
VADPAATPVIFGGDLGTSVPSGIKIFVGLTFKIVESLLDKEMKTPPEGAGRVRVTWNPVVSPILRETFPGSRMSLAIDCTVTLAVVSPIPAPLA